jgi:hypothetical protein
MKDNNYIVIQGWMVNQLKLSGNELMVYALIYGFSQDKVSKFTGSGQYIADSLGISRRSVTTILDSMTKKRYLHKFEYEENRVKLCAYQANVEFIHGEKPCDGMENSSIGHSEKCQGGKAEIAEGHGKNCREGMAKTANNNIYNNININKEKKKEEVSFFDFSQNSQEESEPPDSQKSEGPPPGEKAHTKEDAERIFLKARAFWNERELKPECRSLFIPGDYVTECLRTLQNYSWKEIENAILNYDWHVKGHCPETFKPPTIFKSLFGFLRSGVAQYFDDDALDELFDQPNKKKVAANG